MCEGQVIMQVKGKVRTFVEVCLSLRFFRSAWVLGCLGCVMVSQSFVNIHDSRLFATFQPRCQLVPTSEQ